MGQLRILGTGNMAQSDARWSTVFTVDDIRTDASSLITRLRLAKRASPQFAYSLLTNRESLVIHR